MEEYGAGSPPAYAQVQPRTPLRAYVFGALLLLVVGAGLGGWALTEYQGWRSADTAARLVPVGRTAAAQPVVDLAQRAAALQDSAAAPQTNPATSDAAIPTLPDRVAALEARLAQITLAADSQSGNAARAEALLIAFAARRALDRGLALGTLESQLRLRFGDAQPNAVASVIAAAQAPVTLDRLQGEFDRLTPQLVGANGDQADMWTRFRRGVGELFVVRPADAPSTRTDERLARAVRLLDAGLVDLAAREVTALPGAAAATGWLDEAARYHEARRALDLIETAAILTSREVVPPVAVPTGTTGQASPRRP